jgi:hypothetical protein
VSFHDGFLARYLTRGQLTKLNDSYFVDKQISYSSISFVPEDTDEYKIIGFGSDGNKGCIKVINYQDEIKQNYLGKEIKCCD